MTLVPRQVDDMVQKKNAVAIDTGMTSRHSMNSTTSFNPRDTDVRGRLRYQMKSMESFVGVTDEYIVVHMMIPGVVHYRYMIV